MFNNLKPNTMNKKHKSVVKSNIIGFRLNNDLRKQIEKQAKARKLKISDIIIEAIEKHLNIEAPAPAPAAKAPAPAAKAPAPAAKSIKAQKAELTREIKQESEYIKDLEEILKRSNKHKTKAFYLGNRVNLNDLIKAKAAFKKLQEKREALNNLEIDKKLEKVKKDVVKFRYEESKSKALGSNDMLRVLRNIQRDLTSASLELEKAKEQLKAHKIPLRPINKSAEALNKMQELKENINKIDQKREAIREDWGKYYGLTADGKQISEIKKRVLSEFKAPENKK
jgi:hypothetical protein